METTRKSDKGFPMTWVGSLAQPQISLFSSTNSREIKFSYCSDPPKKCGRKLLLTTEAVPDWMKDVGVTRHMASSDWLT